MPKESRKKVRRTVKLRKNGSLLTVETLNRSICQILEGALSYTRIVQIRGEEANRYGSQVRLIPVACYAYKKDPDGILSTVLCTGSGYLQLIARTLKERGYRVKVRNTHPLDSKLFEPRWGRLEDVHWRYKQKYCLEQMLKHEYGIIDCPTGYGKSFLIAMMCRLCPRAKVAITTHSVDVIEQIHEELSVRLPNIGLVCGRRKLRGDKITCYSGKSLHYCDASVDMLFVDEVHEFATDNYLERLAKPEFRHAKKFGFSATTSSRMDKADFELESVFGQKILKISYQEAVDHKCIVPIKVYWHDVIMDIDPASGYRSASGRNRHGIWQNEVRNEIIRDVARAYDKDHQVLISVDTVEHAMFLKEVLPEFTLCYSGQTIGDDVWNWFLELGLIKDSEIRMTPDRRIKIKKAFEANKLKKVIATTVWKRGVDFKTLSVLIRADSGSSAVADTQIPGRTSRICEDVEKPFAVIHDFKDQFNSTFRNKGYERRRHYKDQGWEQIDPKYGKRSLYRQMSLM